MAKTSADDENDEGEFKGISPLHVLDTEDDDDDQSSDGMAQKKNSPDEDPDEILEMDPETSQIQDTEDGGAIVTLDNETDEDRDPEFFENLIETGLLDETDQVALAQELLESIERDKVAREDRDKQYEEGVRRTGLGDDAPGGATFQGASRVVHPVLTKSCVDFAARVMKELFPRGGSEMGGPVKDQILGDVTPKKVEKAERKVRFMNWQLTQQMPEFRSELEQMLTQVPLAGAQYLKLYWDRRLRRPRPQFIPMDDIYLPYSATSFMAAERKTHVQRITELEYKRRVRSGMYIDVDLPNPETPEISHTEEASEKIEGKTSDAYNEDGLRTIYEIYAYLEIEKDPEVDEEEIAPYIVTIDENTSMVLSVYRNWDPKDTLKQELPWIVEFPFVPWRGAYPIGLIHMIGGLAAASTGALRALLDSAFAQNSQTMAKLKGGIKGGQNIRIQPTEILELEGTPGMDDIRKLLMPLPFNEPSPVLYQLLGFLQDSAERVVQTTFQDIAENNDNMPVGTTLALIEQGMTVFSDIHARLHDAMGRTLKVLHRLNATYLKESEVIHDLGELVVKRKDFEGPMDVVPVSDPNIFSEVHRFAQMQMVAQRAQTMPQLYDLRAVEEMILERTKIPDAAKTLLLPRPEPMKLNAVNENVAASLGRPIVAFPEQDHLAHLQVHLDYLQSPVLGQMPVIQNNFLPAIMGHIREHIAYWYVSEVVNQIQRVTGVKPDKLMDPKDEHLEKAFDQLMAAVSPKVTQEAMQVFASLPPIVQQGVKLLSQMQPPQMGDPTQAQMVAAQAAMIQAKAKQQEAAAKTQQTEATAQSAKAKAQADTQKAQSEAQQAATEATVKSQEIQQKGQIAQADRDSKEAMNRQDNETALIIAGMRGHGSGSIQDGHGLGAGTNPSPGI